MANFWSKPWKNQLQLAAFWYNLVHSGAAWCRLVQLSVFWYNMVHFSQLRAVWCNLVHSGATWCRLVQLGESVATWCSLVQLGAVWCNLVQIGATWWILKFCSLYRQVYPWMFSFFTSVTTVPGCTGTPQQHQNPHRSAHKTHWQTSVPSQVFLSPQPHQQNYPIQPPSSNTPYISTNHFFDQRRKELVNYLMKRGYSRRFLQRAINRVRAIPHHETLKQQEHTNSTTDRTPFVITFNPALYKVSSVLKKHQNILQFSPNCKDTFLVPLVIAYRHHASRRDLLVHSTLHNSSPHAQQPAGVCKWNHPRSLTGPLKTEGSKSKKKEIFPKELIHDYGQNIGYFLSFFSRQYRPGKFVLLYSRTKKEPLYDIRTKR